MVRLFISSVNEWPIFTSTNTHLFAQNGAVGNRNF